MTAPAPPSHPNQRGDDDLFAERLARFHHADSAFHTLLTSLSDHRACILALARSAQTLAHNLQTFFPAPHSPHKPLLQQFLSSQSDLLDSLTHSLLPVFDSDVLAPIKSRVDEFPAVHRLLKDRADLLADMHRWQKKLTSDRKAASRLRHRHRKLQDVSDRYAMYHDDLIKRFNYIDRNMSNFVTPPLRALLSLLSQHSHASAKAFSHLLTLLADTPPITNHAPPPPLSHHHPPPDHHPSDIPCEQWDDLFDNPDDHHDHHLPVLTDDPADPHSETSPTAQPPPPPQPSTQQQQQQYPRPRIRSADPAFPVPKPPSPWSASPPLPDYTLNPSPRRGRSASSAPADPSTSSSTRAPSNLPDVLHHSHPHPHHHHHIGTSAASSTASTDNQVSDRTLSQSHFFSSFHRHPSRRRDHTKDSLDTLASTDDLPRPEVLARVLALYDHVPQEANELELRAGSVVEVTAKNDTGWWSGQMGRARGYFPRNYTRPLTAQEEADYQDEKESRARRRRAHRHNASHDVAPSLPSVPSVSRDGLPAA